MIKPKYKKPFSELERDMYNYDCRQYDTKQAQFERKQVLSCSRLGFMDIDSIIENVIDRLSPKTTHNHNHRPNLFYDNYVIAPIRRIK